MSGSDLNFTTVIHCIFKTHFSGLFYGWFQEVNFFSPEDLKKWFSMGKNTLVIGKKAGGVLKLSSGLCWDCLIVSLMSSRQSACLLPRVGHTPDLIPTSHYQPTWHRHSAGAASSGHLVPLLINTPVKMVSVLLLNHRHKNLVFYVLKSWGISELITLPGDWIGSWAKYLHWVAAGYVDIPVVRDPPQGS